MVNFCYMTASRNPPALQKQHCRNAACGEHTGHPYLGRVQYYCKTLYILIGLKAPASLVLASAERMVASWAYDTAELPRLRDQPLRRTFALHHLVNPLREDSFTATQLVGKGNTLGLLPNLVQHKCSLTKSI